MRLISLNLTEQQVKTILILVSEKMSTQHESENQFDVIHSHLIDGLFPEADFPLMKGF